MLLPISAGDHGGTSRFFARQRSDGHNQNTASMPLIAGTDRGFLG
jgi:hypothetical protein